jgi:hypothetical protein
MAEATELHGELQGGGLGVGGLLGSAGVLEAGGYAVDGEQEQAL